MSKVQMNVKIEKSDLDLAQTVARSRGEGLADFVRRSMRKELARLGFLTPEDMKALEVN
jgi:Rod binding domain-containing protein